MKKSDVIRHYHCCATCVNFEVRKENGKNTTYCSRLGFQTAPSYTFDCWDPKPRVIKALKRKLKDCTD